MIFFQSSIQVVGNVRSDARCGDGFPLDDGSASECDGTSQYPCCSNHGYCGPGAEHCSCAGCVDYRSGTGVGKMGYILEFAEFICKQKKSISIKLTFFDMNVTDGMFDGTGPLARLSPFSVM